jgi:hypothetical protein
MSRKRFRTVALVALIVGIGKCFRFRAWKMADGQGGEHWRRTHSPMFHRRKFHKHKPPWRRDWQRPFEEESREAEPDAEANAAEAAV